MFFYGTNYKRWVGRLELWLRAMNVRFITVERPKGPHGLSQCPTPRDTSFRAAVIGVLGENLVDSYM